MNKIKDMGNFNNFGKYNMTIYEQPYWISQIVKI